MGTLILIKDSPASAIGEESAERLDDLGRRSSKVQSIAESPKFKSRILHMASPSHDRWNEDQWPFCLA
jgi:hypothetical protein